MGAENLAPSGIRTPDRPGRSESLCPLSYSGPHSIMHKQIIFNFVLLLHVSTHVDLLQVIVKRKTFLHCLVYLHDN